MRTQFEPGDRVRDIGEEFVLAGDRFGVVLPGSGDGSDLMLISRPVYPEPGQVVVALRVEDCEKMLESMRRNQTGGMNSSWYDRNADAFEAALRAREQQR